MNNNSVTGRDGYILKQALLYAIAAIESLPREEREQSNKEDMKTILEAMFSETYEKEIADTLWSSILRRFPKWNEDGADKAERPLVIPTGEPRWISEDEDAASPPSPRLRDER